MGLANIAPVVTVFLAGWLTSRIGEKRMIGISLFLTGIVTVLVGVLSGVALKICVVLMAGLAVCFFPPAFAAVSRIVQPTYRSLATAFSTPTAFLLGGGLLPLILGYVGQAGHFSLGIIVIGGLSGRGLGLDPAAAPAGRSRGGLLRTTPMSPSRSEGRRSGHVRRPGPGPHQLRPGRAPLRALGDGSDPELIALARQFGGGIAGTGETCGAVTGAALALSLRDYQAVEAVGPAASRKALQEFTSRFRVEFGALRCRDLTGFDLTTPEGHDAFVRAGGNDKCRSYVAWMCDQVLPLVSPET